MSAQGPLKNWKASAFAAISEYYKVEAERASYEERLEKAQRDCERAGVSFAYGHPSIEHAQDAYACACGTVVIYTYGAKRPVDGEPHYCRECLEKTAAAVTEDSKLEGRPAAVPAAAKADAELPF